MEKIIVAIREFLKLSPQKQVIVALIVIILGLGFLAKYLWEEVRRQESRNDTVQAEYRNLQELRVLDRRLCDQEKFQQQLRSDSILNAEKTALIKFFGGHAEKVEKLLTKKK